MVTMSVCFFIWVMLNAFVLGMIVGVGAFILIMKRHRKKCGGVTIPTPPNMIS
jgi:hypothetical protein